MGVPTPSWAPETVVEAELEVTDWGAEWGPGVMRRSAQLNACGCGIPCQAPEFTHSFNKYLLSIYYFPCGSAGKESACNVGDLGFGKIPWRREWLPTPVFWPGEFHGLYSPWGHKESDTTERLSPCLLCPDSWRLLVFCKLPLT